MSRSILQIQSLDSYYDDFQALYGVDIEVNEDEVVAVIGANGAGKSTLLQSITGLLDNSANQILFRGQAIGALRADQIARLGIALVPEGRQLFQSLTVCLLYTSPSPRDQRGSRMPSSA